MAEQAAGTVATTVINGVTDRALSTVMRKLRSRSRVAATHERLQRLETLVLKLRCAVEVSEKHAIGSASLLEWRDRLREAAAEGGAVVLDFQRRAREEDSSEAAATSASAPGQQQQQPAGGGGGAGAASGALYFTRSALSGMAQRVRDVTRRLFSTDEDMKKLDGALEKMRRLSPDITQFLLTLQLEVSPELGLRPRKRRALTSLPADFQLPLPPSVVRRVMPLPELAMPSSVVESGHRVTLLGSDQRPSKAVAASEIVRLASAAEAPVDPETEARMLARVLERTLQRMNRYTKATDDRDMQGLEWLAEWAAVLREAVERGNAVLQTLCPGSDVIHKAGGALDLEEDGELYSFALAVERLECVSGSPGFAVLLKENLCPRKQ